MPMPPSPSRPAPRPFSRRAGRPVRSAARRSIQPATSARVATATPTDPLELLRLGELEIIGRLTDASNATFLGRVSLDPDPTDLEANDDLPDVSMRCVYKPTRGERPLDDFPYGTLARREVAAYVLSEATGWGIVPPSVMRDGPFGKGMVQQWIDIDEEVDVLALVTGADDRLRPMCVFDALANNADRKGGHILPTPDGHLYGVDHGICFAVEPKLRTILWAWRGQELSSDALAVVRQVCDALDGSLGAELRQLLTRAEVKAIGRRAEELMTTGRFPLPDPFRPVVPWPPF
jgi:uncharacterized repeat protein (TIGR03843 family)